MSNTWKVANANRCSRWFPLYGIQKFFLGGHLDIRVDLGSLTERLVPFPLSEEGQTCVSLALEHPSETISSRHVVITAFSLGGRAGQFCRAALVLDTFGK